MVSYLQNPDRKARESVCIQRWSKE